MSKTTRELAELFGVSKQATLRLFEELQKGYRSLANEKTYTPDELAERLGVE